MLPAAAIRTKFHNRPQSNVTVDEGRGVYSIKSPAFICLTQILHACVHCVDQTTLQRNSSAALTIFWGKLFCTTMVPAVSCMDCIARYENLRPAHCGSMRAPARGADRGTRAAVKVPRVSPNASRSSKPVPTQDQVTWPSFAPLRPVSVTSPHG